MGDLTSLLLYTVYVGSGLQMLSYVSSQLLSDFVALSFLIFFRSFFVRVIIRLYLSQF